MSSALLRVAVSALRAGEMRLDAEASRYVQRVHRLGVGDRLVLFDPEGLLEASAEIVDVAGACCLVRVEGLAAVSSPPELFRCLVQAAGKGDKLDTVVRDATALGATKIVLLDAARSVRRLGGAANNKLERWRRISVQAARQCGRCDIPSIEIAESFSEALEHVARADVRWILEPRAATRLRDRLSVLAPGGTLAVFVGPEGGWTPAELKAAAEAGLEAVRAWPYVLRTETAATALLGAVSAVLDAEQDGPQGAGGGPHTGTGLKR